MESNRSALDKIISVTNSLEVSPGETIREQLITLINELINKDFAALVQLLYRIDVSEKKIKMYLERSQNDYSATVLADLIIERQLEKIESRKKFSEKKPSADNEEKWY